MPQSFDSPPTSRLSNIFVGGGGGVFGGNMSSTATWNSTSWASPEDPINALLRIEERINEKLSELSKKLEIALPLLAQGGYSHEMTQNQVLDIASRVDELEKKMKQ